MVTKRMTLGDTEETLLLCGEQDSNLKELERRFNVQIFARASNLAVRGHVRKVDQAIAYLEDLKNKIHSQSRDGGPPALAAKGVRLIYPAGHREEDSEVVFKTATGKSIRAQTPVQKKYLEAMSQSDMVLSVGPAGTGKTFLAVVSALKDLSSGRVGRIVLTRPVVEAGEKLGFLPGDLYDKINPYLRPLYDAFHTLLGIERFRIYREDETIEIVPLAYMRGRTLENAFVILDEAQNTTPEQMKMFLTRLGNRSKMVITGDISQIDLEFKKRSGFVQVLHILKDIPEVQVIQFSDQDVVRHALVKQILKAYDAYEKSENL
jgi:phosphate starvation-inducible protein PhoH and related proteins